MLPPGTPKERVDILQNSMRKALRDPEFHREFLKLVGDEAEPLMPEELAQAISDTPRDVEITELLKAFSGSGPLPSR
jgi:tripartite-type tricarboxylate transporter receptor subunit TctC